MKKKTIIIAVTVLVLGAVISGAAIGCTAYINDKQLLDIGYHTPTEQLDYVIACHTDSRASLNDVLITYSHGFSIPWLKRLRIS